MIVIRKVVYRMEVAAVAIQQAQLQQNLSMSMVKQQAKAEQALVNLVEQAAQSFSSTRGQNLDISV